MIEHFVTYDENTGKVLMTGTGATGIAADQVGLIAGSAVMVGEANLESDYVDLSGVEPAIAPRPVVSHGWTPTGTAPLTLDMASLPVGASVTATNEAGESVTTVDLADPITLADPETYTVAISPPWPYLPETLMIEVT